MKRKLLPGSATFIALLFLVVSASAQTAKDFFSSSETSSLYLGIDFTLNKFIDYSEGNSSDIRDHQYTSINELIISEPKKFDLAKAFHKSTVDHDLGLVNDKNVKSNTEGMLSTSSSDYHRLKEDDIAGVVKGYDFKGKKGLGVLIVMEAMSKSQKSIAGWFTLVDMSGHKMLFTGRAEGKTGMGFGFRNYWAAAVKNLLEDIQKKKYSEWKSKVGA